MKIGLIAKISFVVVGLAFIGAGGAGYWINQWWQQPLKIDQETLEYTVSAGSSLSYVARDLNQQNVLTHPRLLIAIARLQGKIQIKAGEYQILATDSPRTLLNKLLDGDVITYNFTVVEGWTFKETLKRLHAEAKIEKSLENQDALENFGQSLLNELDEFNIDTDLTLTQRLEGWFFPDTYQYVAGTKDVELLRQAYSRMRDILATEWENRSYDLPYKSIYEALIMASIVERETGVPAERQQIAGVFVRRLQKRMQLQTDPTVIYGLGDDYQGNIRRRHLQQATPYNTYVIFGLPPTPIALPGREAIHAALHPDDSNALYFVAKGDGSHYFSETLEEHNRAVQNYQLKRAPDYRSTPQ